MSDNYVGEIRMFGGSFAPAGWLFCNGQLLPISDYSPLFTLIGTTYGGDGQTTFALPNLQGRIPVHAGPQYALGAMAGTETVTLTAPQIPSHSHALDATTNSANARSPSGALLASGNPIYYATTLSPPVALNPASIGPTGANQPHPNVMPFLAVSFIIASDGIYPQQQ